MIKRRLWIVLMCVVVLAFTGCGGKNKVDKEVSGDVPKNESVTENESVLENETVTENENATEETQKTDNKKNDTTTNKNESTSNKNETTTKPSTGNTDSNKKPSTGSTTKPNTGSTGNSGSTNSGSTNNSGSNGNTQNNNGGTTMQPSTPVHEHIWTEVTEDKIHYYDWINTCFKCGANLTKMTEDDRVYHVAIVCRSSYGVKLVEVDYVTENIQKEPVVTGYKCECGATKGK